MNSQKTAVVLFSMLAALFTAPAQARLGETPDQSRQRHGDPVSQAPAPTANVGLYDNMRLYETGPYYLRVEFLNGRAEMIAVRRKDADPLQKQEIAEILADHAPEKNWQRLPDTPTRKHWQSEDGSRLARYSSVNKLLMIMSRDDARRREQYRRERRQRYKQEERP